MTDQPNASTNEASTPPSAAETVSPAEINEGKAFALLSYVLSLVGLPFFIVPLAMRNNSFSLFHAKQCLMLWLVGIVGGVACGVLTLLCIGALLAPLLGIALLVLDIMGIINASNGVMKPLPVIGKWGEEWFVGLKKA